VQVLLEVDLMSRERFNTRGAVFCALLSTAVVGCASSDDPPVLGTFERHRLELVATTDDPVSELAAREGERVARGQVLVRQDPEVVTARLDAAQAQANEARARLQELERGPRSESIAEARARLAGAEAALDRDTRELVRAEDLVKRRLVSESSLDDARAAKRRSTATVAEMRAQLLSLQRGTRAEQIAQAKGAVAAAEAAVRSEQLSDRRLSIVSPANGVLEALPYRVGERPPRGNPLAVVLDDAAPFARVYVPEVLRASFAPGTRVRVRADGVTDALDGTVRFVSSQAAFTPYYALTQRDRGRLSYLTEIDLDAAAARDWPVGIPVEVELVAATSSARPK
jgi:HlyD family secretion protein